MSTKNGCTCHECCKLPGDAECATILLFWTFASHFSDLRNIAVRLPRLGHSIYLLRLVTEIQHQNLSNEFNPTLKHHHHHHHHHHQQQQQQQQPLRTLTWGSQRYISPPIFGPHLGATTASLQQSSNERSCLSRCIH